MPTFQTRTSLFGGALLLAVATLGVSRTAQASQSFPPVAQAALKAAYGVDFCVPGCTLCHVTTAGGAGTLNPFALNVRAKSGKPFAAGLTGFVGPAFQGYFGTAAAQGPAATTDSNNNGISDWDEITMGNEPGTANILCADIKYGCGASSVASTKPPVDGIGVFTAGITAFGLGLAVLRRRRRER